MTAGVAPRMGTLLRRTGLPARSWSSSGSSLVPLPCPGWAIVFAGVAPLGTEFSWGEPLLEEILRRLAPATAPLHGRPCAVRTLATAAAGVVASVGLSSVLLAG